MKTPDNKEQPSEHAMRAAQSAFGTDYHKIILVELAHHIDQHAIAPAVAEVHEQLTKRSQSLAKAYTSIAERDKRIAELVEALKSAVWAADYLSEQQAMPDDGYSVRLEQARAILAKHGGAHE